MSLCERGFHPSLAIKTVNRMDSAAAAMNGQQRDRLHGYRFFFACAADLARRPVLSSYLLLPIPGFRRGWSASFFWSEE